MGFLKGVMFGAGFSLVVAIFVGLGMAHSSDTTAEKSVDNYCTAHHMAHNMGEDSGNMHGCMNSCDSVGGEECTEEMDENEDGICDMCGMSVEHCLEMKEHHKWR